MQRSTHLHPTSLNSHQHDPTCSALFTHVHVLSHKAATRSRCERSRSSSQRHRPLKQILHVDEYLRLSKLSRQLDRVFVFFAFFAMFCWMFRTVWYKAGNQGVLAMRPGSRVAAKSWKANPCKSYGFRIYVMSDGGLDFSALCAKVCRDHFWTPQKRMRRSSPLYTVVMFLASGWRTSGYSQGSKS